MLEGSAERLGVPGRTCPVCRFDNINNVRGMCRSHQGRFSFRDPIDQLHNIFKDMLLRKITVQFADVRRKPLIADVLMSPFYSGTGLSLTGKLCPRIIQRFPFSVSPPTRATTETARSYPT
jgi:hypothetical protein